MREIEYASRIRQITISNLQEQGPVGAIDCGLLVLGLDGEVSGTLLGLISFVRIRLSDYRSLSGQGWV
jgi:hypothetical protein